MFYIGAEVGLVGQSWSAIQVQISLPDVSREKKYIYSKDQYVHI